MSIGYLRQRDTAKPPSFVVPLRACDCHAHIFGPAERFRFVESSSYRPPDASQADYLRMLGTLGIERMVIVQPSVYGYDNRPTTEAIAAFGLHRGRSIVAVPPDIPMSELRQLDAGGARGVRFITLAHGGGSLDDLRTIAERIAPLGWHIEMYVPSRTWHDLADTILALPVEMVLDHMGGILANEPERGNGQRAVMRLLDSGRCWVKLSGYRSSVAGYPYADVAPLARRLASRVPERCLWGTDWPHPGLAGHMPDDGELLDLLAEWVPDASARRAILVDNPARLFGFSG
jgi:predicted TIM-barrel fold metal-dependent hydrolase